MSTAIEQALAPLLKRNEFRKSRLTWHREAVASTLVFDIQQSEWSDGVYVNLAAYLRELGPQIRPPESKCHIRARLERVCPQDFFETIRSATRQEPISPKLIAAVEWFGLPWLLSLSTLDGVRALLDSQPPGVAIVKNVWAYAGVPVQT